MTDDVSFFMLHQENGRMKGDMIAMEKAIAERLGYLQRHKVMFTSCVCIHFTSCVPCQNLVVIVTVIEGHKVKCTIG